MALPSYTIGTNILKATIADLQIVPINRSEKLCIIAESNGFRYKITNAWLDPNDPERLDLTVTLGVAM